MQAPAPTVFLYVRHGEVPGNTPDHYIYTGSGTDESLTERGISQAADCAKRIVALQQRFGPIAAIYSSPLKRAVQTAQPIAAALHLGIEERAGLKEIDWGSADGQLVEDMDRLWDATEHEVEVLYPTLSERWDHLPVFPGAETYNTLLKRALEEFTTLSKMHPKETVVIVGHGRVLKTLMAHARNSEENLPYPRNCGIAEFHYSPESSLRLVDTFD